MLYIKPELSSNEEGHRFPSGGVLISVPNTTSFPEVTIVRIWSVGEKSQHLGLSGWGDWGGVTQATPLLGLGAGR